MFSGCLFNRHASLCQRDFRGRTRGGTRAAGGLSFSIRVSRNSEYHCQWRGRNLRETRDRIHSSQGLILMGTPAATKGAVSRVATVNPCTYAIAAIWPSATEMNSPGSSATDQGRISDCSPLVKRQNAGSK